MKTRDGVTLYSDIYRPRADGKFPVILMRTPYDKGASWAVTPAYQIATHGYVVVVQDVRGRYTSEGEWYPFRRESDDGYDAVEWVAALPSSDGRVGMMGGSYVGATQMLAAIAHPPHLAGICPVVTASNYHDGWTYQGGALEQWFDQNWTTQLATNTIWRLIAKDTNALLGASTLDRKSTRLNSSHGYISYAVFCLKKKKTTNDSNTPQHTPDLRQNRQALKHRCGALLARPRGASSRVSTPPLGEKMTPRPVAMSCS